jgi:ribosomal protein S18 acetylase RimI-like enzyme
MNIDNQNLTFRQLDETEQNPYDLLLLADPSIKLIEEYLKSSLIFVAENEEKIIGTIVLQPLANNIMEIKNIAVLPKLQGQGIGKYLIENITEIARQMNCKIIQIGTANSSVGQLYLYQKLGFNISEIKYNFFLENYSEQIYESGIQAKHLLLLKKILQ